MRWLLLTILLMIPLATGCRLPPVNVHADGNLAAAIVPTTGQGPVRGMRLPHRPFLPDAPRIAILDVDGLLVNTDMTGIFSQGENPVSVFRERLDAIAADCRVGAVVLRINSPGGGVTATDMMWHDLQSFKARTELPVVACLLDVGAGGAYYLATAADEIIAHPTSVTGGIGVIFNHYNLQDAMAQFNIIGAPIKAGKNIDLGTPIAALDDERRQLVAVDGERISRTFPSCSFTVASRDRRRRRGNFRWAGIHGSASARQRPD